MSGLYVWPPPKRKVSLSVLVPSSILSIEQSLYEKTILLGFLARALAVFRVDEFLVFVDDDRMSRDLNLIVDVMEYLLTPPYLRRKVISKKDTLRYAGVLPPLNIATHPTTDEGIEVLPFREGLLLKILGTRVKVDVGLGENLVAEIPKDLANELDLRVGAKVYVRITKVRPLRGVLVSEADIPYYSGFKLRIVDSLEILIEMLKDAGVLGVITSKCGESASRLLHEFSSNLKKMIIMFGNHRKDFNELVSGKASNSLNNLVKISINTIPLQGVRSVRTVEALYATLTLINELMYRSGIDS
ncbi:MAG: putative RNA uridine N3 methyltransferase [Sulfolobales archaeon]|nr:RNA methyltransferase [Sulfolobales archaeon]MDW7968886.1 putative RNA uridine N3 methyltransferase [Sulfolobales archaeon]